MIILIFKQFLLFYSVDFKYIIHHVLMFFLLEKCHGERHMNHGEVNICRFKLVLQHIKCFESFTIQVVFTGIYVCVDVI